MDFQLLQLAMMSEELWGPDIQQMSKATVARFLGQVRNREPANCFVALVRPLYMYTLHFPAISYIRAIRPKAPPAQIAGPQILPPFVYPEHRTGNDQQQE